MQSHVFVLIKYFQIQSSGIKTSSGFRSTLVDLAGTFPITGKTQSKQLIMLSRVARFEQTFHPDTSK